MRVLIYNNQTNRMESYSRDLDSPIPYSYQRTLLVREFTRNSDTDICWTSKATIDSWNTTRISFNRPIYVGAAFKRIFEGGHSDMSQHYAGLAFDMGQTLTYSLRQQLYNLSNNLSIWSYVEPFYLTERWVHVDKRYGTAACLYGGYPLLRLGALGVYVLILQDALTFLGFNTNGIDGYFGNNTRNALIRFQRANELTVDGICGCQSWTRITSNF